MPKDKVEPGCLQKRYFFEETKCYLFLICLSAVCLPELTGASIALHLRMNVHACV